MGFKRLFFDRLKNGRNAFRNLPLGDTDPSQPGDHPCGSHADAGAEGPTPVEAIEVAMPRHVAGRGLPPVGTGQPFPRQGRVEGQGQP